MNSLISPAMTYIVLLLFLYKDGFGIKYTMKFDMPLNKESNPKLSPTKGYIFTSPSFWDR